MGFAFALLYLPEKPLRGFVVYFAHFVIFSSHIRIFRSLACHQKKVLALVLAFACAFTMFAGAAFTDAADINPDNADAVELLTTLGIIKGYEDGSFDPEGVVTRAEMAKMIYSIRNGGNDNASAHVGNTTSFTDISGHWAEGYIKYLQNTGIVAGKSATKFVPNAQVTTTEAMKMALALAGYDEKNAGLTGADWSKNTLTLATTIGLTDDVASAMSAGCTRQDAAQILANVLEATAVRYSAIVENFVNDSKTGLSYGGDPITVGYKWMDLSVYVGRMTSSGDLRIDGTAAGKDRFKVDVDTVDGKAYSNRRGTVLEFKDGKDHTDLVGMEVKVLTGEKIDEVYGVYATDTSNVVETTMDQVSYDRDGLKIDDVVYDCEHGRVNGDIVTAVYADNEGAQTIDAVFSVNDEDIQKVADSVKLIDWDDDGKYETIIVKTVSMAEVTFVGSSSITLGSIGSRDTDVLTDYRSLDFDDDTIYEDVAVGDYAVVTMNLYNSNWIAEKAEEISGTVNGLVENERRIRIDGEWYTLANTNNDADGDDANDLCTIPSTRSIFANGDEVALYLVGDIAYMAKSTTGNDANRPVLMVYDKGIDVGAWNDSYQVKAIFADGDKDVLDLDFDPDGAVDFDEINIGQMYSYEINNDGEYALTELDADIPATLAGYDDVVASNGVTNNRAGGYTISDSAVVFALIGGDDADVYTGAQVKDAADRDNYGDGDYLQALIQTEGGYTYARMLNIELNSGLNGSTNYGYLLSDAVKSKTEKNTMEYHFWDGSDVTDKNESTNADKRSLKADMLFSYDNDGDGIKNVEKVTMAGDDLRYAAIRSGAGGDENDISIRYRDLRTGEIRNDVIEADGDTQVIYVNSEYSGDAVGVEGNGYNYPADRDSNGNYHVNAAYILGDNGKVDFILIDVGGNLTYVEDGRDTVPGEKSSSVTAERTNKNVTSGTSTEDGMIYGGRTELTYTVTSKGFEATDTNEIKATVRNSDGDVIAAATNVIGGSLYPKMDITGDATKTGTVVLASKLDADTYTITLTAGDAVLLVDTFTVEPVTITSADVATAFDNAVNIKATAFGGVDTYGDMMSAANLANVTYTESYSVNGKVYDNLLPVPSTSKGTYNIEATITFTANDNYAFNDTTAYVAQDLTPAGWENTDLTVSDDGSTLTLVYTGTTTVTAP